MTASIPYTALPNGLNQACRTGDVSAVYNRLQNGDKPDADTLTFACFSRNFSIVSEVLKRGARPDGETLTSACETRNIEIINAVLKAGALPDEDTLSAACRTNQAVVVSRVLQAGARVSEDAILVAKETRNSEILHLLDSARASATLTMLSVCHPKSRQTELVSHAVQAPPVSEPPQKRRRIFLDPQKDELTHAMEWLRDLQFIQCTDTGILRKYAARAPKFELMPPELKDAIAMVELQLTYETRPYYSDAQSDFYATGDLDQRQNEFGHAIARAMRALRMLK